MKSILLAICLIVTQQLLAQKQKTTYTRVDSVSIYFAKNSSNVTDVTALQLFLQKYKDSTQVLQLCSYTDTVGGLAANTNLGNARQFAVREKIDSLHGSYKSLQGRNLHESKFIGDKKTALQQQRRVDVVVLKPVLPPPPPPVAAGLKYEVGKPLNLNILFQNSSANILPKSIANVKKLYETMNNDPALKVQLNGHVCCMDDYRMSLERAEAVRNKLVQMGISPSRITCKGFSNKKPVALDDTPENMEKNRRVEAVLTRE